MPESDTHRFLKNKIAQSFEELGYDVKTEALTTEGRLDVLAKKNGNEVKIEICKTHIPEWIIVKVAGDIVGLRENKTKRTKNQSIATNRLTRILTPREKRILEHFVKGGIKLEGFSRIKSSARKAYPNLENDLALIRSVLKKE